MSLCGNCPIPFHEDLPIDEDCPYQCSYQDAVYKTQQAFWDLYNEYERLRDKMDWTSNSNSDSGDDYCE